MIFGLVAVFCWFFLFCAILAFPIVAIRRNRLGMAVVSAFLLGGLLAAALVWRSARPGGLPFRESLRAGLTDAGLRQYGHPIEHRAEVAICFSTYAWVLGGGLCAGVALAGLRTLSRRRAV